MASKQQEAIRYISENYLQFNRIRHDVVSDKLQIRLLGEEGKGERQEYWREMTRQDINSIVCQCAQECDSNITSREVMTVLQSDLVPSVHPLREYIQSCRTWTGEVDWIDSVARQVKVKPSGEEAKGDKATGEELWRECFKRWFVAMVASWMKDEVVNQQVLVLIGRQGIYKTTWLERLIPPHLRPYSCKLANTNDLNKDERMRIAEFGLIALDEIDSMNHRELNQLKSVITSSDVNERAAYAYTKERRVRLASFCASGNRRDFLTDLTGNRRWLPFEVESIQNPYFTVLPYEMMYAQAWALAQDPTFSYWFDLDEIEVLEQHNQQFRDESNEEQLLPILFDIPAKGKGEFLTTAQISERLVSFGNIKKPMALSRLGMVLGTAGYKATKRKIGNTQTRGWIVYQRDTDKISTLRRILKD